MPGLAEGVRDGPVPRVERILRPASHPPAAVWLSLGGRQGGPGLRGTRKTRQAREQEGE